MDYFNLNLDVHYILTEYSMHIFICAIVGFGSLIYCLSIKSPDCVFTSPKLSKKKQKKEKPSRSKNIKSVPIKIETKETVNVAIKHNEEVVNIEKDLNEDDKNSTWQAVVKPKRIVKSDKMTIKLTKEPSQNNNDCDKLQPIALASKPIKETCVTIETKSITKPIVIENVCDKPKRKKSLELTKSIEKILIPDTPIDRIDISRPHQQKHHHVEEQSKNLSESPSNSSTDDFEMVDIYKTSSEDGLKIEIEPITDESIQPSTSSTSGASRKKNKKHQKMISKQLIEAATTVEDDRRRLENISNQSQTASITMATVLKKRRPRKDI